MSSAPKAIPPRWQRMFAGEEHRINVATLKLGKKKRCAHHVLLYLVVCDECTYRYHSYQQIAEDTGYSERAVKIAAKYLRDVLRVIEWTPGHGGKGYAGPPKANTYRIDYRVLKALKEKQACKPANASDAGCTAQEQAGEYDYKQYFDVPACSPVHTTA